MTVPGVILGTTAYMAPEQAKGKPVDRRADIWAFGCVLFEMLTGHRAFAGKTPSDVLVGIIEREPDWQTLPVRTPAAIRRLLRRWSRRIPSGGSIRQRSPVSTSRRPRGSRLPSCQRQSRDVAQRGDHCLGRSRSGSHPAGDDDACRSRAFARAAGAVGNHLLVR